MNNTSTEHVSKNFFELALNVKKSIDINLLLAIVLAGIGLSVVTLYKEAFTCPSTRGTIVAKPRHFLTSDGYASRVINQDSPSIYESPKTEHALLADVVKPTLEVAGIREIEEPLTFSMSDFHDDMTYVIDFGNGTTVPLQKQTIPHIYEQPGTYKVTVRGMKEGVTKVLSTKFLMVADAIETPDFIAEVEI